MEGFALSSLPFPPPTFPEPAGALELHCCSLIAAERLSPSNQKYWTMVTVASCPAIILPCCRSLPRVDVHQPDNHTGTRLHLSTQTVKKIVHGRGVTSSQNHPTDLANKSTQHVKSLSSLPRHILPLSNTKTKKNVHVAVSAYATSSPKAERRCFCILS